MHKVIVNGESVTQSAVTSNQAAFAARGLVAREDVSNLDRFGHSRVMESGSIVTIERSGNPLVADVYG